MRRLCFFTLILLLAWNSAGLDGTWKIWDAEALRRMR
jgi:hypothetical protein